MPVFRADYCIRDTQQEDNFLTVGLSFHYVGSKDTIQAFCLGDNNFLLDNLPHCPNLIVFSKC